MPTPPRVFVSHSHEDDVFTSRLASDLRVHGVEVWVDTSNLHHGNWLERIDRALAECEWLILVLTPNALNSQPVRTEVFTALDMVSRGRMTGVIPVIAEACSPASVWPLLSPLHYYDAIRDYTAALDGLLRALGIETTIQVTPGDSPVMPVQWTTEELARLWNRITPGARRALAEIVRKPDGYPFSELLTALDMNGPTLGGYLSSLGFALRDFPGRTDPLTRDWRAEVYKLAPDIAGTIRQLAEKDGTAA